MSVAPAKTLVGQRTIVSLISTGHCYSHLTSVALAPLFPLLREAFDVSYVALGALVATFSIATSVAQIPIGLLVDRYGGRLILVVGLVLLGGCFVLMGGASAFWHLFVLVAFAGLGNSVFHPADLSIISRRVDESYLGRTVSLHSFVGYVGWAIAPMTMLGLSAVFGWQGALIGAGIIGLAIATLIQWRRAAFDDEPQPEASVAGEAREGAPFDLRGRLMAMTKGPMIAIFLFFMLTSATIGGITAFAAISLMELFGVDRAAGNMGVTVYLSAMAGGVLFGGILADRIKEHDRLAAWTVGAAAAVLALLAFGIGGVIAAIAILGTSGFLLGIASPSRDLIVRAAAPAESMGLAFGFTSTGLSIGFGVGPVAVGWLMDMARPDLGVLLLAAMSAVAVLTLVARRRAAAPA